MRRASLLRDLLRGKALVPGQARGALLHADVPLSFWGGIDPASAAVIDRHHPLHGANVAGRVLAIPSGRGSCTGSLVVLELLLGGLAPAAVLLRRPDEIISLGAIVAEELFGRSLPVVALGDAFEKLGSGAWASVEAGGVVRIGRETAGLEAAGGSGEAVGEDRGAEGVAGLGELSEPVLTDADKAMLDGAQGKAAQAAMRIVQRAAAVQGATELLDVVQAHIDGCTYIGPSSLHFAQKLVEWGGQVRVPTTLNSIGVDDRRWRELGVPPEVGQPASDLGAAYVALGAKPTFTCAPYLLETAPKQGEHVAWGESNAVVFANSCLGARTQKYADLLDICVALTGRAPHVGCHRSEERLATLLLRAPAAPCPEDPDADAFWPALGYLCGLAAAERVPVITGLETSSPSRDDLKAFSAAFGTTAAAPLFHMAGQTPEAPDVSAVIASEAEEQQLSRDSLVAAWRQLDKGGDQVELVSLGNPHFSLEECARLAALFVGRRRHEAVQVVVTLGRSTLEAADAAGHAAALRRFGAELLTDTCWCMLGEPVVPLGARTLLTNSAKFAHYGPGLLDRQVRFASLAGCVEAACSGLAPRAPRWLEARS